MLLGNKTVKEVKQILLTGLTHHKIMKGGYMYGTTLIALLLLMSKTEGGITGNCFGNVDECSDHNTRISDSGFQTCRERCICNGFGLGRCVNHSAYSCRDPAMPYRCMCYMRRAGPKPSGC